MSPNDFEGRYTSFGSDGPRPCKVTHWPDDFTTVPQFQLSFDDAPQPRPAMTGPVRSLGTLPLSLFGPLGTVKEIV